MPRTAPHRRTPFRSAPPDGRFLGPHQTAAMLAAWDRQALTSLPDCFAAMGLVLHALDDRFPARLRAGSRLLPQQRQLSAEAHRPFVPLPLAPHCIAERARYAALAARTVPHDRGSSSLRGILGFRVERRGLPAGRTSRPPRSLRSGQYTPSDRVKPARPDLWRPYHRRLS
jgi:hypothetical protein